jgi:hypothetical protein
MGKELPRAGTKACGAVPKDQAAHHATMEMESFPIRGTNCTVHEHEYMGNREGNEAACIALQATLVHTRFLLMVVIFFIPVVHKKASANNVEYMDPS